MYLAAWPSAAKGSHEQPKAQATSSRAGLTCVRIEEGEGQVIQQAAGAARRKCAPHAGER